MNSARYVLVGGAILLLLSVEYARRGLHMSTSVLRRGTHLGAGLINIVASVLVTRQEIIVVNLCFALLLLVGRKRQIFSVIQVVDRQSYGDIFFPLGIVIAAVFFLPDHLLAFQFGVAIMGGADAMAGLVGERWGRHPVTVWRMKGAKTVEGSVAFFLTSVLLAWGLVPGIGALIFGLALILTVAELGLVYGLDNLILPVLAGSLVVFLM